MSANSHLNVLLLDDDPHLVEVYAEWLREKDRLNVVTSTDGIKAREIGSRQLFDAVVIDAKVPYRGEHFGGLQLADDFRMRYGKHSIIVVSQYIKVDELRLRETDHEFIDKQVGRTVAGFMEHLSERITALRAQQYVFVAMPFDNAYQSLYDRYIKAGIEMAGFRCIRADDVQHTRPMHDVLFELVKNSKLVLFVADGANPNAYYEAGFADAMAKEVVIVARSIDHLKFDVSNRLTLTYGRRPSVLADRISSMILALCQTGTNL